MLFVSVQVRRCPLVRLIPRRAANSHLPAVLHVPEVRVRFREQEQVLVRRSSPALTAAQDVALIGSTFIAPWTRNQNSVTIFARLRLLQLLHAATTFSLLCAPPLDSGIT